MVKSIPLEDTLRKQIKTKYIRWRINLITSECTSTLAVNIMASNPKRAMRRYLRPFSENAEIRGVTIWETELRGSYALAYHPILHRSAPKEHLHIKTVRYLSAVEYCGEYG